MQYHPDKFPEKNLRPPDSGAHPDDLAPRGEPALKFHSFWPGLILPDLDRRSHCELIKLYNEAKEEVIGLIRDDDAFVERYLVSMLRGVNDADIVEVLTTIAANKKEPVPLRIRCLHCLAESQNPFAFYLVEQLAFKLDGKAEIRAVAAQVAATMTDPEIQSTLRAQTGWRAFPLRLWAKMTGGEGRLDQKELAAIRYYARCSDASSERFLQRKVESGEGIFALRAAESLAERASSSNAGTLIRFLARQIDSHLIGALADRLAKVDLTSSYPEIRALTKDPRPEIRLVGISLLARVNNSSALQDLETIALDSQQNAQLRITALAGLFDWNRSLAECVAVRFIIGDNIELAEGAADLLAQPQSRPAVDALRRTITVHGGTLGARARAALQGVKDEHCLTRLLGMLNIEDENLAFIRENAAYALRYCTTPSIVNSLIEMIDDREAKVETRVAACIALYRNELPVAQKSLLSFARDSIIPDLDRIEAIKSLHSTSDLTVQRELARLFSDPATSTPLKVVIVSSLAGATHKLAIEGVIRSLESGNSNEMRKAALRTLATIDDPRSCDALTSVFGNTSMPLELRLNAGHSLLNSTRIQSLKALTISLGDSVPAIRAVGLTGVRKILKSGDNL